MGDGFLERRGRGRRELRAEGGVVDDERPGQAYMRVRLSDLVDRLVG
jgi:hypothetical protein